jgi:hypothetical protein
MDTRGVQNAQMHGAQSTEANPEKGEWPWVIMAEGDHPLGFARV